jgi:hypothetical protein
MALPASRCTINDARALALLFALTIVPVVALATGPQEKLATSYIMAAASGDPAALLGLYHPGELEDLRMRILKALELEEQQGGNAIRSRLFGAAASIQEIRRLTPDNFYLSVARAVMLPPERIEEVRILGIVEENSQLSHAWRASATQGRQCTPADRGSESDPLRQGVARAAAGMVASAGRRGAHRAG